MKTKLQKYIDKHIKSMTIERHGDKFYGTLTDVEGRTFEFSEEALEIERHFNNTPGTLHKNADIREAMLMKHFQILFVGIYANNRELGVLK